MADAIVFHRTDFEYGVAYEEPLVHVTAPCAFDNWNRIVDWNFDNNDWRNLEHRDDSGTLFFTSPIPVPGPGTYKAVAKFWFHCKGDGGMWSKIFDNGASPVAISVYGRIPVDRLVVTSIPNTKRFSVEGDLSAGAPPSGTRVFFRSLKGSVSLPPFIVVPPKAVKFSLEAIGHAASPTQDQIIATSAYDVPSNPFLVNP